MSPFCCGVVIGHILFSFLVVIQSRRKPRQSNVDALEGNQQDDDPFQQMGLKGREKLAEQAKQRHEQGRC